MTTNNSIKPDIFITGVMKGGTTILHDYICTHPEIESGSQKEIHYFSLHYSKGPDWYASHFSDVKAGMRTIDASPTYFDAANTLQIPQLINAFASDPRVILITRDPIARAISQFTHMKFTNKIDALKNMEIDEFFSTSLADCYRQSDDIGFSLNQIISFSMYYRKLINYMHVFENKQFLAVDNDALRNNPADTMQKIFDFVDLPFVDNEMFGVVKHSNGSSISNVSKETYDKLAELFYPDYQKYCERTDITFKETPYAMEQLQKTGS